jgi:hypothetical protein
MSLSYILTVNAKWLSYYGIDLFSGLQTVRMTVRLPDENVGDGDYVCVPYAGLVSYDDGEIVDLNYLTRSADAETENVYDAIYCPQESGWTGSGLDGLLDDIASLQLYMSDYGDLLDGTDNLQKYMELEQSYRAFVYKYDLEVPDRVSRLRDEYEGVTFDNLSDAISFVQEEVARDATYTLEPASRPYGEDFIEYFMYENKEGYCTYFASAAVMIFRCLGIPARFAQGYIIPPMRADEEVNVDDSYAHAWAEIYVDGFGWLPVEVTPGFGGRAGSFTPEMNQGETAQDEEHASTSTEETTEDLTLPQDTTEEETDTAEDENVTSENENVTSEDETDLSEDHSGEMTEEPSDTGTADSSEKENATKTMPSMENSHGTQEKGTGGAAVGSDEEQEPKKTGISKQALLVIKKLVIVMILLVLAGAVLYSHHRSRCAARQRRFNQRSSRNGCLAIYRELCRMSARYYIPVDDQTSAHELSLLFPNVEEETWEQVQQIAKEAAFSTHDITDEKKQLMLAVYHKCCRRVDERLRFMKKLLFHIWDGYR